MVLYACIEIFSDFFYLILFLWSNQSYWNFLINQNNKNEKNMAQKWFFQNATRGHMVFQKWLMKTRFWKNELAFHWHCFLYHIIIFDKDSSSTFQILKIIIILLALYLTHQNVPIVISITTVQTCNYLQAWDASVHNGTKERV